IILLEFEEIRDRKPNAPSLLKLNQTWPIDGARDGDDHDTM
ncbi:unnamed protein product, partial [Allacma fusca]